MKTTASRICYVLFFFGLFYGLTLSEGLAKILTIENIPVKRISAAHYAAVDYDRIRIYQKYFDNPESRIRIAAVLKRSGVKTLRFHSPVYDHWNVSFSEWKSEAHYGSDMLANVISDVEFLRWCKDNGFKVILQVNTSNYFDPAKKKVFLVNDHPEYITKIASNIHELIKAIDGKKLLDTILYVEFGNEDYIGMHGFPGTVPEYYARIVAQAIKNIRPSYPGLKFCVVGQSVDWNFTVPKQKGDWSVAEWEKRMFQELKNNGMTSAEINYAAHHAYADDEATGLHLAKGGRGVANDVPPWEADWNEYKKYKVSDTGTVSAMKDYLINIGFANTQIEINEFRRGGYNSYYSRSYMNLLANLDPWTSFINDKNVSGTVLWASFNNADIYNKPNYLSIPTGHGVFQEIADGHFVPSMPGYLFNIMSEFMDDGDTVLPVDDLNCSVLRNDRVLKILYYSKNANETTLKINIKGDIPLGKVKQSIFYADRLDEFVINPSTKKLGMMHVENASYPAASSIIKIKPFSVNVITIDILKQ